MKTNMSTILSLLFVSILTVTSTMAVAQDDAAAIVQKYNDARAQGDLDAVLVFFADDAIVDGGGPCSRSPCVGKAAIRKALEHMLKGSKHTITASYPSGSVVTQRHEVRHKMASKAGAERVISWLIYEVKSGKIVSIRLLRERTDPQTARYIKWQQEHKSMGAR